MKHCKAVPVVPSTSKTTRTAKPSAVVGIDVGDRWSRFCVLDWKTGEVVRKGRVPTTALGFSRLLAKQKRLRVIIEVGTHSGWMSRQIHELGHQVLVANARKVRAISHSDRKSDELDALMLARLGRVDPALLFPIEHRGPQAQADLAVLRARNELVECRAKLINSTRGTVKAFGHRLKACSTPAFHKRAADSIPEELQPALQPLLEQIRDLTARIAEYDKLIAVVSARYPAVPFLLQIKGVGPITALAFILTLEDPGRFKSARSVGPYLGLCPKLHASGQEDQQLRITKAGDVTLRSLLVNCAHYILGPFGPDSDLRRHGLKIASRGGKNAKKRAVVAVARKLAVVLLALWKTRATYEPLRHCQAEGSSAVSA